MFADFVMYYDEIQVEDTLEEALDSAEPELNVSVSTLEKSNGTQNELGMSCLY